MFSIVLGLIAICLGLWGILSFWWYVIDVMIAVLPLLLLFGGFVALMAGIRNSGFKENLSGSNGEKADEPVEEPAVE